MEWLAIIIGVIVSAVEIGVSVNNANENNKRIDRARDDQKENFRKAGVSKMLQALSTAAANSTALSIRKSVALKSRTQASINASLQQAYGEGANVSTRYRVAATASQKLADGDKSYAMGRATSTRKI